MTPRPLAPAAFVAAIIAANYLSARHGLVPVGFGLAVSAGTFAAGAALTARDLVQDLYGVRATLALIAAAGALSWWLSSPALAVASVTAFALSELVDLAIYTPLRRRSWQAAVWVSFAVGALVDTYVFLRLAGFPVGATAIAGQLLGKAYATVPFSAARAWKDLRCRSALPT